MTPTSTSKAVSRPLRALILGGLLLISGTLPAQILGNPSMEGATGSIPPNPWSNCGGSPDTQILQGNGQGIFGINTPPQDGNTYLGFVTSGVSYVEAIGQPVSLTAGTAFSGQVALFRSTLHSAWNGTGQCQIWGGSSCTNRVELLWSSGTISNLNSWQNYPISFSPTMNHSWIIFVNYMNPGSGNMDYFCMDNIILSSAVLPVEVLEFEAIDQATGIGLNWETERLQAPHTFEVEWSVDAANFEKVATLEAKAGESAFHLLHTAPMPGQNYYRLRMVDPNGQESYSPIRQAEHEKNHLLQLFPNPSSTEVTIGLRLYEAVRVEVRMLDAAGRAVYQRGQHKAAGMQEMTLDLPEQVAQGLYLMEIRMGDQVTHKYLTVQ